MFQKPHGLKILSTYSCASQDLFHFVCSNYIIYYIQNVYVCTVVNIHIQKSFFFFLNRKPLSFLSLPCMSNVLNSLTQEEQREHFSGSVGCWQSFKHPVSLGRHHFLWSFLSLLADRKCATLTGESRRICP